jgi:hypothetical protein
MAFPEPIAPEALRPDVDAALLAARAEVAEVVVTLRRCAALSWDSPAADRFRSAVAELLAALEADLRALEEAAAVVRP